MPEPEKSTDQHVHEGPQTRLELKFIEEYLLSQGYQRSDLSQLPEAEAKRLMTAASRYATVKLAELEARAKFRKEISID